jgi:hypothetical protein
MAAASCSTVGEPNVSLRAAGEPTGQAHHRVTVRERVAAVDEDRGRAGEPQFRGLRVGANHPELDIDVGPTGGVEGKREPLSRDGQVWAALDEPHLDIHFSMMRLPRP